MTRPAWARWVLDRFGVGLIAIAAIDGAAPEIYIAPVLQRALATEIKAKGNATVPAHSFIGMWVTADGRVRHELLPNGRYDEARGGRKSAYQGRYEISGNHIDYRDDTGFTADGDFIDGVLHHGGMVLRREP